MKTFFQEWINRFVALLRWNLHERRTIQKLNILPVSARACLNESSVGLHINLDYFIPRSYVSLSFVVSIFILIPIVLFKFCYHCTKESELGARLVSWVYFKLKNYKFAKHDNIRCYKIQLCFKTQSSESNFPLYPVIWRGKSRRKWKSFLLCLHDHSVLN